MTDSCNFIILKPDNATSPEQLAYSLSKKLQTEKELHKKNNEALVWARVFFSDIINQLPAVENSELKETLDKYAVSYIEQPPVDGSRITIMAQFAKNATVESIANNIKRIITPQGIYIYHTVRFKSDEIKNADGRQQTMLAFERHKALLAQYGMTIADNTVRTWLFVRDIDRNYSGVVKGRNEFFSQNGLAVDTHFIASTGICGYSDCPDAVVAVDFLSKENIKAGEIKYLHALDHLNPTAEYGVAFERGTALNTGINTTSYISGTASIDKHGNCIYLNDPEKQTERLIENIGALLADANTRLSDIKAVIAYIRDYSDRHTVERVLKAKLGDVPTVITLAKVCRPQWLVEAECIACKDE